MDTQITTNFENLLYLIKNLNPDQKLEISATGQIKIIHYTQDHKKKSQKAGNLFIHADEITPLQGKSFASVNSKATGNYLDFGKPLPKKSPKDLELKILLGIYEMLLNPDKVDHFTDSNSVKYTVKHGGKIKGFYNKSGKLRFIEYLDQRHYIPEIQPELKTEWLNKEKVNQLIPS